MKKNRGVLGFGRCKVEEAKKDKEEAKLEGSHGCVHEWPEH